MTKVIMTVDDSASIRQMIAFMLKSEGYDVIEAEDGVDALAKLEERTADLILTDLNMPNMNGIELIKNLRTNDTYRFTPIMLLTTVSQEEKKLEGKRAGATGWIVKPFNSDQLSACIRKVLA